MITKEQIEKEAKKIYPQHDNLWMVYENEENDLKVEGFIVGANWALEQCPYSREDMIDFGQMCLAYIPKADVYCRRNSFGYGVVKNLGELFKKWEEQK